MDKIQKALNKLTDKEKILVKQILIHLDKGEFDVLNIQKLAGYSDIFRVRKGKIRIIYKKSVDSIFILTIERRTDNTYRKF